MNITPLIPEDSMIIQGYSANGIKVNGKVYDKPLLVQNSSLSEISGAANETIINDLGALKEMLKDSDVILLGTGKTILHLSTSQKASLKEEYGLYVETMDTGAACRTFNVLMSEGRKISALLLPL